MKEFLYLGSKFMRDRKYDSDIERRVLAGNKVNGALYYFKSSQKVERLDVHIGPHAYVW